MPLPRVEEYLAQHSAKPTSIANYRRQLTYLGEWLDHSGLTIDGLTPADFLHFVSYRGWSHNSGRHALKCLHGYLRYSDPEHRLLEFKIKHRDPGPQRTMTAPKLAKCLDACSDTVAGRQMRLIMLVAAETWCRASELVAIDVTRINLATNTLVVWSEKMSEFQTKAFSPSTGDAISDWMQTRQAIAKPDVPELFVNTRTGRKLTTDGLRGNFRHLSIKVGFPVSAHDFRRGGATAAAERGANARLAMAQGGWRSFEQYRQYSRAAEVRAVVPFLMTSDLEEEKVDAPTAIDAPS